MADTTDATAQINLVAIDIGTFLRLRKRKRTSSFSNRYSRRTRFRFTCQPSWRSRRWIIR